ncbi:hypothetical protein GM3709_2776 [Geminocystis sp. NIES-3709]|nr:hypothetical protein GM3709_2776 [Geminocystis sp. NIES-3709]
MFFLRQKLSSIVRHHFVIEFLSCKIDKNILKKETSTLKINLPSVR